MRGEVAAQLRGTDRALHDERHGIRSQTLGRHRAEGTPSARQRKAAEDRPLLDPCRIEPRA